MGAAGALFAERQGVRSVFVLDDNDFGYVGLAYAVYTFAALVQQGGVLEVLVQRGRNFEQLANAAFWMSIGALNVKFGNASVISAGPRNSRVPSCSSQVASR